MKLGDDEKKVAEVFFSGGRDASNMSILTNRRLVVVYKNAEESYPLSKITSVKYIFKRSIRNVVLGVVLILIALGVIGKSAIFGLLLLLGGGALAYFGWKGKTQLLIGQMGGNKFYNVRGKNKTLTDFIESVNSKLS